MPQIITLTRGQKNKIRHREQMAKKPRLKYCPDCGGLMGWCIICNTWTKTCCIEFGTCECS